MPRLTAIISSIRVKALEWRAVVMGGSTQRGRQAGIVVGEARHLRRAHAHRFRHRPTIEDVVVITVGTVDAELYGARTTALIAAQARATLGHQHRGDIAARCESRDIAGEA